MEILIIDNAKLAIQHVLLVMDLLKDIVKAVQIKLSYNLEPKFILHGKNFGLTLVLYLAFNIKVMDSFVKLLVQVVLMLINKHLDVNHVIVNVQLVVVLTITNVYHVLKIAIWKEHHA